MTATQQFDRELEIGWVDLGQDIALLDGIGVAYRRADDGAGNQRGDLGGRGADIGVVGLDRLRGDQKPVEHRGDGDDGQDQAEADEPGLPRGAAARGGGGRVEVDRLGAGLRH